MNRSVASLALVAGLMTGPAAAVEITIACGGVPNNRETCAVPAQIWAAATGNTVEVRSASNDTNLRYAAFRKMLDAQDSSVDVLEIDVVHAATFADGLLDLSEHIPASELAEHLPDLSDLGTVGDRLVSVPWMADVGLMFFRYDLLTRYGKRVPQTWAELLEIASYIQEQERKRSGNEDFYGYVFTGENYEGLTCNALEWIVSSGGAGLVDASGRITINTPAAVEALETAASWIGNISPTRVTGFTEVSARLMFQRGNALFMRGWPTDFHPMRNDPNSPVAGLFLAAPMPGDGQDTDHVSVGGGWMLAVNADSAHPDEAASLVRYLTSRIVQRRRAIESGIAPTRVDLYDDRDVLRTNPVFAAMVPMLGRAILRPSEYVGRDYMEASAAFSTRVHAVLKGEAEAGPALEAAEADLKRLKNRSWGARD